MGQKVSNALGVHAWRTPGTQHQPSNPQRTLEPDGFELVLYAIAIELRKRSLVHYMGLSGRGFNPFDPSNPALLRIRQLIEVGGELPATGYRQYRFDIHGFSANFNRRRNTLLNIKFLESSAPYNGDFLGKHMFGSNTIKQSWEATPRKDRRIIEAAARDIIPLLGR